MRRVAEFEARARYLALPVSQHAPVVRAAIAVDGSEQPPFRIRLAGDEPEYWVGADIGAYRGRRVALLTDAPDADESTAVLSDRIPGTDDLYEERHRPQFHFSAGRGWINDPNGLVHYDGTYHLFFQHNPYGVDWGNMHWGHATSTDLVHWREQGEALYPDALGTCFSGSAVVDWANTSGLGDGDAPPLVCAYTSAGEPFTQSLAYSADGGGTWQKYDANPVVPHLVGQNRDPKVIWHAPTERWIMALYLDGHDYGLLASRDLRSWELLQEITLPGGSECPDLFPLALEGDPGVTYWVLWGANGSYLVGDFDGSSFAPIQAPARLAGQGDSYAAQTWSDIPQEDGRRLQIAWLRGHLPAMPFDQQMTFPHSLALRATPQGMRLAAEPAMEIAGLYQQEHRWEELVVRAGEDPLAEVAGELFDIEAEVFLGDSDGFGLSVRGVPVVYDAAKERFWCYGRACRCPQRDGAVRVRILVDRASVEIYANDGLAVLPLSVLVAEGGAPIRTLVRKGEVVFRSLRIGVLRSIW